MDSPTEQNKDDVAQIEQLGQSAAALKAELAKVIVGQEQVIGQLLITLFSSGHALLVGVPGLAKTLLVSSIAKTLSLSFSRIQFTPDLMPADITGTDILQETSAGRREFEFVKGPVHANMILADEINRAPAKTQSALLEAMQESRVTVLGRSYTLDAPFFVLATENPVEQEGTYPLPEAQLDRFMFLVDVDYPSAQEEIEIARRTTSSPTQELSPILTAEQILHYQKLIRRVPVPEHIYEHAVNLVRSTRPGSKEAPDWLSGYVSWGAGPRAVQYLVLGAKAHAALKGSYITRIEDLEQVILPVLNHRILTNFSAQSEGLGSGQIIERLQAELAEKAR